MKVGKECEPSNYIMGREEDEPKGKMNNDND